MDRPASARHQLARLAGIVALLAAVGCSRPASLPASAAVEFAAAPAKAFPAEAPGATPTVAEGERWGEQFAALLAVGDVEAAAQRIDWDEVFTAATHGTRVPERFRAGFVSEARRCVARSGFVTQLARAASSGGSVAPVRCRVDGDGCHLLMRVIQDSGLNYHDYHLVRSGTETSAADADVLLAGEQLSATIRRLFLINVATAAIPLADEPEATDATVLHNAAALRQLLTAADDGDHAGVLEVAAGLPASLLAEKPLLMARAIAAVRSGSEQQDQAVADLRAGFPDDASVDLVSIDHHAQHHDRDSCLEAIDHLDRRLGGDPYLDVLRATVHLGASDYAQATRAVEAALAALPKLPQPYWVRLAIALEQQRHDETALWLDLIAERFGVGFPDLEMIPEYAAFVRSPEYRAWKSRRGG